MTEVEPWRADISALFLALANGDRLQLLRVLRERHESTLAPDFPGLTITALARAAELSRYSASRHLAILRRAGIVCADRVGPSALHRLAPTRFEAIEDWLYPFLDATAAREIGAGTSR